MIRFFRKRHTSQRAKSGDMCVLRRQGLRVACELVEDDRLEAKKSMLDAYPNLREMYDKNDDNTQVFYIKNATATLCGH